MQAFVRRILVHNDQQCSLFLQQRVRLTTPDKKYKLCQAVGKQVLDLSLSKFGSSSFFPFVLSNYHRVTSRSC